MRHLLVWLHEKEVLLASAPVCAYGFAYVFELGKANFYGYPQSLIKIDFQLSIIGLAFAVFLIWPMFSLASAFFIFIRKQKYADFFIFMALLVIFALSVASIFVWRDPLLKVALAVIAWGHISSHGWRKRDAEKTKVTNLSFDIPTEHWPFLVIWIASVVYLCGAIYGYRSQNIHTFELGAARYALVATYGDIGVGIKSEADRLIHGESVTVGMAGLKLSRTRNSVSPDLIKTEKSEEDMATPPTSQHK